MNEKLNCLRYVGNRTGFEYEDPCFRKSPNTVGKDTAINFWPGTMFFGSNQVKQKNVLVCSKKGIENATYGLP